MQVREVEYQADVTSGTSPRRRGGRGSGSGSRVEDILQAAQDILIEEGPGAMSLRRIADRLDISSGNVTYYFRTKDVLLKALIEDVLQGYIKAFETQSQDFPDDPKGRFLAYIDFLVADCRNPRMRALFYQIWAMATYNVRMARLRDQIYVECFRQISEIVGLLNPGCEEGLRDDTTRVLMAMIEGLHVIFGLGHTDCESESLQTAFRDNVLRVALAPSDQ